MGLHSTDRNYIPRSDDELVTWVTNYAQVVEADPAAAGLSASDAALLAQRAADFNEKYRVVNSPERTPLAVALKNDSKKEAIRDFRQYSQRIKANPNVSVELKLALGLHVPELAAPKAPLGPPTTRPILTCAAITADGTYCMRYVDESTPDSRAKPRGVQCMQLFGVYFTHDASEAEQSRPPERGTFLGSFSTTPFMIRLPERENGKYVKLYARWTRANGLVGPWSEPVQVIVQGSD